MMRRLVLGIGLLALAACGAGEPVERPNLILIIGDDHSYPYFGFMGSELVQTPHLDRLAREGTTFSHGYTTASACRRSLIALLTGLHPDQWDARNEMLARQGIELVDFFQIEHYLTLPKLLGRAGVVSFQGGKYWEGPYALGGFSYGTKDDGGERPMDALAGGGGLELGRSTMQPVWDFLDEYGADRRFFVWFAPSLPHRKFDPPQRFVDLYEGRNLTRQAQLYYANITRFDERVGELLTYLDDHDLRKNTLVVYLSDNGWEQPPYRETGFFGADHGKNSIYEYGFRTPIVFSWPGHIPQGRLLDDLVSTVDLFPTFLDYAGIDTPPERLGVSLRPVLTGEGAHPRQRVIGSVKAVRRTDPSSQSGSTITTERAYFLRESAWRYVWYADRDREELYRIEEDPEERHDLAAAHPERLAQYRREVEAWRQQLAAPYVSDLVGP